MENIQYLIILIISSILLITLTIVLTKKNKKKNQINTIFTLCLMCMLFWTFSLILQILFQNTNTDPIFFEGLASFGASIISVLFMLLGIIFSNTKIKFNWKYFLLFIIPILSIILMFTNSQHHLFFKYYSTNASEVITGPYHPISTIYSYSCILIGLFYLLKYSIKNSGFFSKQSILIFFGEVIPLTINVLATFGILKLTVYATPVSFTIAMIFFALAIFKFDFLKVTPIALQKIVDRMSDSYFLLNDDLIVTDFNKPLLDTFKVAASSMRNSNIIDIIKQNSNYSINLDTFTKAVEDAKQKNSTIVIEKHFTSIDKYFNIEINTITNKGNFLATLVLFKDVTQHHKDMETIKENQDMLIEKERLASLGQMIGGIAHNLKTPIMSIAGAAEGLSDLTKEYDVSIGDPEVTESDHHEIVHDMDEWIEKIRTHLSYMSDVITAVKGQAVTFADTSSSGFTVNELIKYIDILMKHELKNALINLNTTTNINLDTKIKGNINSLVQVVNNIISNAIQAYNGKTNENILLDLYESKNKLVIKIEDFAGGLPDKVQKKLFKEMITTKGKNGTGLGLFMSYSNIKAHFNGNMKYETEKGKGTSFFIEIPLE